MNKSFIRWFGIVILAFVLQSTIVKVISFYGVKPDLILLALFFLALKTEVIPAVFAGFFMGLALDFYSPTVLGQDALAMSITGFFMGFFNEKIMRLDPIFMFGLLIVSFFIHDILFFLVLVAGKNLNFTNFLVKLLTFTLPRALYTLFLVVIVHLLVNILSVRRHRF
ncbi:MAG: rod shape-determining protein MreD [Chitinispirillaceae bacterium]|nr:rod shape-determining protein MreD [Chitinispirillaceae bacterium]